MRYVFDEYTLDPEHYELRQAGTLVPLEPRVFDLLTYLIQHPGHTVTTEELLEQLYPNQFAPVDRLTNCVAQARKALHDTGQTQHYIQTVRRRGYRFIASVTAEQSPEMDARRPPTAETSLAAAQRGLDQVDTSPPMVLQPTPLPAPAPAQDTASGPCTPAQAIPDAERRQLTVLVCRLVGMPALADPLDPEVLLDVARDYHALCTDVVRQFDGHIAQYQGDRLVVYFGYPQAHEDDARRAMHTGFGIVTGMAALNRGLKLDQEMSLAVRVGVHTGVVVMDARRRGDTREPLALGDAPTIAAQVQDLATPDAMVVSASTWQLVEDYFVGRPLGASLLEHTAEPLAVYQVLQERTPPSRSVGTTGPTLLIGREQELGLFQERWAQATEGWGQMVLLSGEAGIGKSHLVQAWTASLSGDAYTCLECRGSPYFQHTAFYPIVTSLQRFLRFNREDPAPERLRKLEEALTASGFLHGEEVPLLAALLMLPPPERYTALALAPERQRQKTLEALLAWLLKEAERQPVCVVMDDLHWVDPSTLEWLSLLIDQLPTARILLLLLCRPEFRPPWKGHSYCTHLALSRLSPRQTAEMIQHVAGGKILPAEVMQQVVATTDGVPLFVEELTRMVLESGLLKEREGRYELTGPLPPLAIPATLHESLMARLDRLGPAKQVAQLGAVVGREFPSTVLQAVWPLAAETLQQGLTQLVDAELLYQRGLPPAARYRFKHALIQEAAYQSLLRRTRQQYHQHIAHVLEAQEPETVARHPEVLAQHYTAAGRSAQALPHWYQAGRQAMERSAYVEALAHLRQGLAALASLPDTRGRRQQELRLQAALGPVCMAIYGHAAPEVEHAYARARELCHDLGDTPELFPVLAGLAKFSIMRADFQAAHTLGHQCLSLAQRMQEAIPLVVAHWVVGATACWQGHLATARQHIEQGLKWWDWPQYRRQHTRYPVVPGVQCLAYLGVILWLQGYPDQALARLQEALALAHEVVHPYSLAMALFYAARLSQARGEQQAVHTQAMALRTLAAEQRYAFWETQGQILQGWAQAAQQPVAGLMPMHQGLLAYQATGAEIGREYFLLLLAEVAEHAGQHAAGQDWLDEAQVVVQATGARYCAAELRRLQGELWQQQTAAESSQVEACFQEALALARQQQAKAWELRAAVRLSRLWQQHGRHQEAHDLLAPIYGWFTEGFDTADLQEARALLDALQQV